MDIEAEYALKYLANTRQEEDWYAHSELGILASDVGELAHIALYKFIDGSVIFLSLETNDIEEAGIADREINPEYFEYFQMGLTS